MQGFVFLFLSGFLEVSGLGYGSGRKSGGFFWGVVDSWENERQCIFTSLQHVFDLKKYGFRGGKGY